MERGLRRGQRHLRNGDGEVSAAILLDGLHASFLNGAPRGMVETIEGLTVAPIVAFAQRAALGEKLFYFSHSAIATEGYAASTSLLAELLLRRVGVRPRAAEPTDDPLGLLSYVDEQGFHQRSFGGNDKRAHCDYTRNIEEALVQLVAPRGRRRRLRRSEDRGCSLWHTRTAV